MNLSISQRLALTAAVLAGLILAPVGTLFYLALNRTMETRAMDLVYSQALEIKRSIWAQLDEDILFDFTAIP